MMCDVWCAVYDLWCAVWRTVWCVDVGKWEDVGGYGVIAWVSVQHWSVHTCKVKSMICGVVWMWM